MPGAKKGKRKRFSHDDRKTLVAHLYLKGHAQTAIAEHLKVNQSTVSRMLTAVRKEWMAHRIDDFNALIAMQLERVDALEIEAWKEYRRSRRPKERRRTKTKSLVKGKSKDLIIAEREEILLTEERIGDPRFLDRVAWCIAERNRILQVYKTEILIGGTGQPIDINLTRKEVEEMDAHSLLALAKSLTN